MSHPPAGGEESVGPGLGEGPAQEAGDGRWWPLGKGIVEAGQVANGPTASGPTRAAAGAGTSKWVATAPKLAVFAEVPPGVRPPAVAGRDLGMSRRFPLVC